MALAHISQIKLSPPARSTSPKIFLPKKSLNVSNIRLFSNGTNISSSEVSKNGNSNTNQQQKKRININDILNQQEEISEELSDQIFDKVITDHKKRVDSTLRDSINDAAFIEYIAGILPRDKGGNEMLSPEEVESMKPEAPVDKIYPARPKKLQCQICHHPGKSYLFNAMNVQFLASFMNSSGKILPRRMTGNCAKHQRVLARTIKKGVHLGVFSYKSSMFMKKIPYFEPRHIELGVPKRENIEPLEGEVDPIAHINDLLADANEQFANDQKNANLLTEAEDPNVLVEEEEDDFESPLGELEQHDSGFVEDFKFSSEREDLEEWRDEEIQEELKEYQLKPEDESAFNDIMLEATEKALRRAELISKASSGLASPKYKNLTLDQVLVELFGNKYGINNTKDGAKQSQKQQ